MSTGTIIPVPLKAVFEVDVQDDERSAQQRGRTKARSPTDYVGSPRRHAPSKCRAQRRKPSESPLPRVPKSSENTRSAQLELKT
mmetsp:Transcript_9732/g.17556  ORF Transcript_9732/g.17556 Transcript_9732/m.17556 type:complete len:84 (+) Transcript_9732:240-491(+)